MTKYNTGNPVGSSSPLDLYDNAENLDAGINGSGVTWNDRLGRSRRSWNGILTEFDQFVGANGLKRYPSWAALQADTSRGVGFAADVINDPGTHVDPVSGQSVSNSGQYRWSGTSWQWLRADTITEKASRDSVAALGYLLGDTGELESAVLGSTTAAGGPAVAASMFGNAVPLPFRALLLRISARFLGPAAGQFHVLSPRANGAGTYTAAILPVSITAAGVVTISPEYTAEAGSYIVYKPISGVNICFDEPGGTPPGSARWLVGDSVNIGDIQGSPVVGPAIRMSLRVDYQGQDSPPLAERVERAETAASSAEANATLASRYLGLEDVDASTVPLGSVSATYTGNANVANGYGIAEPSPGGYMSQVQAVFVGAGQAIIEAQDANKVVIARHQVEFGNGTNTWRAGESFPQTFVPAGGHVYMRSVSGNNVRYDGSAGAGPGLSTTGFTQATALGQVQEWQVSPINVAMRVEFQVLSKTLADVLEPVVAPTLIDERFNGSASGWVLNGAALADGALVSQASSTWASKSYPAPYGKSQLSRRTLSAVADIVAADQVWGLGWIREASGTVLDTPAAIVDGVTGQLRVYRWDGTTTPAAAVAEIAIPWPLTGSRVRLDVKRVRFATYITLTNLISGQNVQLVLDYGAGTGANSGRPWGTPCVVFPGTIAGGVKVDRVRMVADYPFPTARAARVLLMGDSITEGSQIGAANYGKTWSYMLEDERVAAGAIDTAVIARGGQRADHLRAAGSEALGLCDRNTVVVILIGTNDALGGVTRAVWRANVEALLSQLRTRTSRISLACLPPLPTAAALRAQYNDDILTGYFGAHLLPPVRFDLALSDANDGTIWAASMQVGDNVHPNVAGNAAMLERIRTDLREAFE